MARSVMLRVHHLSCLSLHPPFPKGIVHRTGTMVCHCLLIEHEQGLVLVDTGIGLADVAHPHERLGRVFLNVTRPTLDPATTAIRQVERLGFRANDVRHIVVTHLDLDHAGGLPDFPDAEVHLIGAEQRAALHPPTLLERHRYRPPHFAHGPKWVLHEPGGERWFGFDSVRALVDRWPEVLLIPVAGHTRGHAAVAVRSDSGWIVHAGDAYFDRREMHATSPTCSPGLAFFQRFIAVDDTLRRKNRDRLRALACDHAAEVRVFSAHDPDDLAAFVSGTP